MLLCRFGASLCEIALRSYQILSILSILSSSKIDKNCFHLHHLPESTRWIFFSFQQRLATEHVLDLWTLKIERANRALLRRPNRRLELLEFFGVLQDVCPGLPGKPNSWGFFNSSAPNKRCHYPLVNVNKKKLWKTTMLLMGKSTILMAILT